MRHGTHRKTQKLSRYKGFTGLDLGVERRLEWNELRLQFCWVWQQHHCWSGGLCTGIKQTEAWSACAGSPPILAMEGMVSVCRKPPQYRLWEHG